MNRIVDTITVVILLFIIAILVGPLKPLQVILYGGLVVLTQILIHLVELHRKK